MTDVFFKDGCKIPDVTVSELIKLIDKGIMSSNSEENKSQIFEATLHVFGVTRGNTIDDLKSFLGPSFRNEMYAEKGKNMG